MTILFAQPYDISATGFYFETAEDYAAKARTCRNDFGQPVEEFEIQFIDGEAIDAALARAFELNQANLARFFEIVEDWDENGKIRFILAVGECGYGFNPDNVEPDDFDVDLYRVDSLRDLAVEFIEEGLFGDIPERLNRYLDFDAIAHELAADYSESMIAGERLVYRCG